MEKISGKKNVWIIFIDLMHLHQGSRAFKQDKF